MMRYDEYQRLKNEIVSCRLCEDRFGFEPHPVLMGNVNAKIMQISQAPSQNVHYSGIPFDDASGKRLRREWYQISDEVFYDPDNFYITAMAHCFPGKSPGGGDRAPPTACAKKWLPKEMELVDNTIFLLIGGKAAKYFFPDKDFTALVFADGTINGKPAFVLPHPSPLNAKWFKEHPEFMDVRIREIRNAVHQALGM